VRSTGLWWDPTAQDLTPHASTPQCPPDSDRSGTPDPQHLDQGRCLAELAAENGISERSARKWLERDCFAEGFANRSGGPAALAVRRSVRRTQRRTLDPQKLQRAVELRHQRCTLRRIVRLLLVPISTLARAMRRLGLNRLRNLDPQREAPLRWNGRRCSDGSGSCLAT
jgi:hypothetical protein